VCNAQDQNGSKDFRRDGAAEVNIFDPQTVTEFVLPPTESASFKTNFNAKNSHPWYPFLGTKTSLNVTRQEEIGSLVLKAALVRLQMRLMFERREQAEMGSEEATKFYFFDDGFLVGHYCDAFA
jgi:hypothetical protein